jgi:nucleotide-binding universal stress UspA family protein
MTLTRIERILCPTDFSEFSERALRWSASLARWFKARVTALHVIEPVPWACPRQRTGLRRGCRARSDSAP